MEQKLKINHNDNDNNIKIRKYLISKIVYYISSKLLNWIK
jgi:hypothetical protein